jgi:DNA helicase-2/ATP-dependent DNA helicase PcrA
LQLALNPEDDVSFLRVVGTPTRGVGDKTVEKLRRSTEVSGIDSLFDAARYAAGWAERVGTGLERIDPDPSGTAGAEALDVVEGIGGRPKGGLDEFCRLIVGLREGLVDEQGLAELTEHLLDRINYFEWIEDRDPERADDKKRNVVELTEAMRDFDPDPETSAESAPVDEARGPETVILQSEGGRRLQSFLERSSLVRDSDAPEEGGVVTLMTVHGAKGLEFDTVFVAGMEDALFPNVRDEEPVEVQEERRLAYVAFTRAEERLYITNARRRRLYGKTRRTRPSRFLLEIDEEQLNLDSRSFVDEIDYGRDRGGWRSRGSRGARGSDGLQGHGEDWHFDQSAERQISELGEAIADEATHEDAAFSQVDLDAASDREEQNRGEGRPGENTEHELVGATVTHNRFGIGEVVAVTNQGSKTRLKVQFPTEGKQTVYRKFVKVVG